MSVRGFFVRTSRVGLWLLAAAAVAIAFAGVLLAFGQPRAHTLTAYAAVFLAALGVFLALPAALFEKDTLR
jgi:hypothetical protein